jgi:alkylhydroperoxidase family enzyme
VAFIDTPADDDAVALYDADRERLGYVANYTRLFAHRPAVNAAWQQLNAAIKDAMDLRRYELATLASARELRSSYCALAHGKVLAEQFYDGPTVAALAADHRSAGLEPVDVAVMDVAEKVANDAVRGTRGRRSPSRAGPGRRGDPRRRARSGGPCFLQQDPRGARSRAR